MNVEVRHEKEPRLRLGRRPRRQKVDGMVSDITREVFEAKGLLDDGFIGHHETKCLACVVLGRDTVRVHFAHWCVGVGRAEVRIVRVGVWRKAIVLAVLHLVAVDAQVPFSRHASRVPRLFQRGRDRHMLRWVEPSRVRWGRNHAVLFNVAHAPRADRIPASLKRCARWRADRRRRDPVREFHALFEKRVDVGRGVVAAAESAQVAVPHVIDQNHQHVGLRG